MREKDQRSNSSVVQFRLTDWAYDKVENKRKRKGLGELRARNKHPIKQFLVDNINVTLGLVAIAPLERVRTVQ